MPAWNFRRSRFGRAAPGAQAIADLEEKLINTCFFQNDKRNQGLRLFIAEHAHLIGDYKV
mgnify:CR=1